MEPAWYYRPQLARGIAIFVIALVFLAAGGPMLVETSLGRKIPDDFHVVYSGARAVLDRAEIYTATNRMFIYSPFVAFVFQPLALFPERIAATIWLLSITIIIFAAALIAASEVVRTWQLSRDNTNRVWVVAGAALLLNFEKIRSEFVLGQMDCLILLGLALLLWCANHRPRFAPLVVGITANFKYLALIFAPYFLLKKRYRAAVASLLWFAFFFILPSIEIGGRLIFDYSLNAVAVLGKVVAGRNYVEASMGGDKPVVNSVAWDNSVSITSSIFRATQWLGISDAAAWIMVVVLFVIIVAAFIWIGHRHNIALLRPTTAEGTRAAQIVSIEWASLIVLALIFGPQTTARHMIMLMLVYVVGITLIYVESRRGRRILLAGLMIGAALMLSLPFRQTGVHPVLIGLKSASIASWCALLLMFAIAGAGCRLIKEKGKSKN